MKQKKMTVAFQVERRKQLKKIYRKKGRNEKKKKMDAPDTVRKRALLRDVRRLPVYRDHRNNLRPWDRKLPVLLKQEVDQLDRWELEPPTGNRIFVTLLLCLLFYQLQWIIPYAVNQKKIWIVWENIALPSMVYFEPKVFAALWVVTHLCSGLSLWMVWLTEGFERHPWELLCLAIAFFAECPWLDVVFSTYRLDYTLAIWFCILVSEIVAMILMIRNGVKIGALFVLPMLAMTVAVLVYAFAFYDMYGKQITWLMDKPRAPQPQPNPSAFA